MVSSCNSLDLLLRRIAIAVTTVALASLPLAANAQSQSQHSFSSSADLRAYLDEDIDGSSLAAAPGPSPSPKPQYGQTNSRYSSYESPWSHVAFEAGGGFNAPVSDAGTFSTYGGNLTLGAGWNFNKVFGALLEYQFIHDKIPGATLSAVGAPGGYTQVWSFTIDPVVNIPTTGRLGAYFIGGGGFYRKVTTFTTPVPVEYCDYFGFCYEGTENAVIGHFSSNQGGMNIGGGVTWRAFGPDTKAKLFAEARYVWVDSPRGTDTEQGTGTFTTVPVTFGIRW